MATGLVASSKTDSQIVAFLRCFGLPGPVLRASAQDLRPFGTADHIIQWFAMETHYRSIGTGVVVLGDVAWFVAYIALALAMAQNHLQPRRA